MPITRDEVVWAYRMFLGREPESSAAVEGHMTVADRDTLRDVFMKSAEFDIVGNKDRASIAAVGAYQDVKFIPVDVACSDEQLSRMLEHVATEWRKYGAEEPHWSVLTSNAFKSENIADNIESFYETGRGHAAVMLNPLNRSGIDARHFQRVMDFGCGVGRLTLALAPIADAIVGVDISPPHLELARKRAGTNSNAQFVAISSIDDFEALGRFDLIVSFIVLQHNPPPVMAAILSKLLSCLAIGGCIIIQIPTYIEGYEFNVGRYLADPAPGITANPLPQADIFRIFAESDCDMLEVRQDGSLGTALSHTFVARKRE